MKTILVDAINTFVIKGEGIYRPLYDLLERYPNPKIILTNADDEQIKQLCLAKMPYELFTLKHNPDKVDPTYFKTFLKKYNLDVKDVVYFEHNMDAIKSAESLGITSFHYDSEKKDIISLKNFLDSNL